MTTLLGFMRDRKQHRITALQRMGYEAGHSSYGDDWGIEDEGYTIFAPDGSIVCREIAFSLEDTEGEAWDNFLELIGKV